MEFLELVNKRRSVRKYSERKIPRDLIDRCIETARLAPSASNSQPWSFIVIDDERTKNELCDKAFSGVYMSNVFVKKAPVVVVVITEKANYITRLGGMLRKVQYSLIDVGIACEHLVLQAEELGIGTCWLGWFDEKAVKKVLNLPKSVQIDVMISMGYPTEVKTVTKKRKTLEEIRRYFKQ